jgi:hypothetical protein
MMSRKGDNELRRRQVFVETFALIALQHPVRSGVGARRQNFFVSV